MSTERPRYLGVFAFFEEVPEPRVERTRDHPLMTVLAIALLTIICVGDGWKDMNAFGVAKEAWLATFLDMRKGVPSADTFRRVLGAIEPAYVTARAFRQDRFDRLPRRPPGDTHQGLARQVA